MRLIIVVILGSAFGVFLTWQYNKGQQQVFVPENTQQRSFLTIGSGDHIRGERDAPVTVIEYADLECRFCKILAGTMDKLYQMYGTTGQVRFVFRHFPLGIWDRSVPEAIAAECAGEQKGDGGFYTYLNMLFARTPSENGLDPAILLQIAASIGLHMQDFATCRANPAVQKRVTDDHLLGVIAGIDIVPTTFIVSSRGATKIIGHQSYEIFDSAIQTALGGSATRDN